uniref:Uncharacterized protein n=1 Tax=Odontella aurita TaxID=265563 RepID=A0A7S4HNM9_9STRA|mmetsp:Transcript_12835/g.37717  ORF Transcript_12835/g.37717 Transcript_12835/m.37717 type:complete len:105 (+) Transcript_12835:149-463(+)
MPLYYSFSQRYMRGHSSKDKNEQLREKFSLEARIIVPNPTKDNRELSTDSVLTHKGTMKNRIEVSTAFLLHFSYPVFDLSRAMESTWKEKNTQNRFMLPKHFIS